MGAVRKRVTQYRFCSSFALLLRAAFISQPPSLINFFLWLLLRLLAAGTTARKKMLLWVELTLLIIEEKNIINVHRGVPSGNKQVNQVCV
ncbi:MAG: hypothetical protein ABJ311_00475 [Erythrobacter sp.]